MTADRIPGDFGSTLREARERKGITLRQIATATKISVAVLEALERNDIARLPGGIFSRAFVRSYAAEVGLDPEAIIKDFVAAFPDDSVTAGHPASQKFEEMEAFESDRRVAGSFLWILIVSVPIAGAMLYLNAFGHRGEPRAEPSAVNVSAPPAPASTSTPATPAVAEPAAAPASAVSPAAARVESTGETKPDTEGTLSAATAPIAAAAAAAAVDSLTVGLSARRPVWISATVDGQKAIERLLRAGERQTVEVRREMVLTAGDASAVELTLNGMSAKTLGKAGEVMTARLTLNNFREYLQPR